LAELNPAEQTIELAQGDCASTAPPRDFPALLSRFFLLNPDWYAKHFRTLLTLLFLIGFAWLVASGYVGDSGDVIVGDGILWFEYARSLAVDGHLPETFIKYPVGISLSGFWTYAPSIWVTKFLQAQGFMSHQVYHDGWGLLNQIAFCIPFYLIAYFAILANLSMLRHLGFSERIAKTTLIFWIIVTSIFFYLFKEPAMSEGSTYSWLSFYYWALILGFYSKPGEAATERDARHYLKYAALAGAALGMASMIRQQNVLHCFSAPLIIAAEAGARYQGDLKRQAKLVFPSVAVTAIISVILFSIPFFVWAMQGEPTVYSYGKEGFNVMKPKLIRLLFHPLYHGFYTWHPIFGIATVGLIYFFMKNPKLALPFTIAIFVQVYLMATWWAISFGSSFGHRGFYTLFPIFLCGLTMATKWFFERRLAPIYLMLLIALTAVNLVLIFLITTGVISGEGVPIGELWQEFEREAHLK
jgi:hypothetical protein